MSPMSTRIIERVCSTAYFFSPGSPLVLLKAFDSSTSLPPAPTNDEGLLSCISDFDATLANLSADVSSREQTAPSTHISNWLERTKWSKHFDSVPKENISPACTPKLYYRSDFPLHAICAAVQLLTSAANSSCLDLCVRLRMRLNSFQEGRLRAKPWKGVSRPATLRKYSHYWQKLFCYVIQVKFRNSGLPTSLFHLTSEQHTHFQELLLSARAFVQQPSTSQLDLSSEQGISSPSTYFF